MITLRLDPKLEKNIQDVAMQMGISKSELIRKSISEYIENLEKPSPWELGRNLFGKYSSGKKRLSKDRKSSLRNKISAKKE